MRKSFLFITAENFREINLLLTLCVVNSIYCFSLVFSRHRKTENERKQNLNEIFFRSQNMVEKYFSALTLARRKKIAHSTERQNFVIGRSEFSWQGYGSLEEIYTNRCGNFIRNWATFNHHWEGKITGELKMNQTIWKCAVERASQMLLNAGVSAWVI